MTIPTNAERLGIGSSRCERCQRNFNDYETQLALFITVTRTDSKGVFKICHRCDREILTEWAIKREEVNELA